MRGVREEVLIDAPLITSADARRLDSYTAHLQDIYVKAATLRRKDDTHIIHSPSQPLDAGMAAGPKRTPSLSYTSDAADDVSS